jgi:hypothetical protein
MSAADLLPSIQSLPRADKIHLVKLLLDDLREHDLEPLPEGFPPPEDQCPSSREELEWLRRQPGLYTLDEILRSLGVP